MPAFPNLSFGLLTFLTHAGDGSNRVFAVQRAGQIRVFANTPSVGSAGVFLDLSSKVDLFAGEAGVAGLAFDPDYRGNGWFYVVYTPPGRKIRLSRFSVSADPNVADPNSERVIVEYDHATEYHFGGWIGFGPDRMLYLSTGDNSRDPSLQDPASPYGKVLRMRINADGTYSVPGDNPWGNLTWAMGFRNPWRCSFDRVAGGLWCGDVGDTQRDEIDIVRRGAHYGWAFYEGDVVGPVPPTQPYSSFAPPVYAYGRSVGGSVIGGYVYRGTRFAGLYGRYVYGDYVSWRVWALTTDASGQLADVTQIASEVGGITTFGEDEAGELLVGTGEGRVLRFEPQ